MKHIAVAIKKFMDENKYYKLALYDLSVIPLGYEEALTIISATNCFSVQTDYNPIFFLSVPGIVMLWGGLRRWVSPNTKLASFLEPMMKTWLLTSFFYCSVFCVSYIIKFGMKTQSTGSFLAIYALVGFIIYQKKNFRPVFFDPSQYNLGSYKVKPGHP